MAADGSTSLMSTLGGAQPELPGPYFIDTGGCRCALEIEINKEAWRCISNTTQDIYAGNSGKWFYAVCQSDSGSLNEPANSDTNPPDLSTQYEVQNGQIEQFPNPAKGDPELQNVVCNGNNDTQASTKFYQNVANVVLGRDLPCWQPGAVPLNLQNASEWNAMGCHHGFFCECICSAMIRRSRQIGVN